MTSRTDIGHDHAAALSSPLHYTTEKNATQKNLE